MVSRRYEEVYTTVSHELVREMFKSPTKSPIRQALNRMIREGGWKNWEELLWQLAHDLRGLSDDC